MKFKSLIAASSLFITSAGVYAQEATNADLTLVTENVDLDGQFFMANNIEGDLSKLAALGTDYVQTARANGNERFPEGLDFSALLTDLGMDQLFAYGRSAKFAGDHWVNKMYLQNNGSTKGVFSMMGEENSSYDVIHYAPSGSDLVMEWNVDTRQLMEGIESLPRYAKMDRFLNRKVPQGGTMEDVLNTFTAKISLAVKLDDEVREVCPVHPKYTFPKIHGCMRMLGANQVWDQVGAMAGFMMKIETLEDGTLLMTPRKQRKAKDMVLLMDVENDLLWVATSPEFLNECRDTELPKIANDDNFRTISGASTEGNALAYISRQACLEIRQVKEAKYEKKGKKPLSDPMMEKVMNHLTESENGYYAEVYKSENGVHMVLKVPCPVKEMIGGKGCFRKKSSWKRKAKKKQVEKQES